MLRLGSIVVCLLAVLGGCASPCARVKATHQELTTRTEPRASGDHVRLSIPMRLVDTLVARELKSLPQPQLALPEVAGVSLGSVRVRIDRIKLLPGKPGQVAFSMQATLTSGRRALLPITVAAAVRPRLSNYNSSVLVALDKQGLVNMQASIPRGGLRGLTDALWAELPAAARMLTTKGQLAGLAQSLSSDLMREATSLIKGELLDDLGRVARFEVDLPIEANAINVRSVDQDLVVGFQTPLPVKNALPASPRRTAPAHQVQLSVAPSAAVELVNRAMDRNEAPGRFDLNGNADPNGPLHARLDWSGGGPKPLVVHAFLLDPQAAGRPKKDCAHVTLRATPNVRADGGHLVLSTADAKIEEVRGSVAVKAGLFFSGVGRKSFELVERLATDTRFDLGAQTLQAQVHSATLRGTGLVVGLSLSDVDAQRTRRSRAPATSSPSGSDRRRTGSRNRNPPRRPNRP